MRTVAHRGVKPNREPRFIDSSSSLHQPFNLAAYNYFMNLWNPDNWTHLRSAPEYRVLVTLKDAVHAEGRLREVVRRKRGELIALQIDTLRHPDRVELHLGLRRIDDVVAALEGEGFEIAGVVATSATGREGSTASAAPASRARSSNL